MPGKNQQKRAEKGAEHAQMVFTRELAVVKEALAELEDAWNVVKNSSPEELSPELRTEVEARVEYVRKELTDRALKARDVYLAELKQLGVDVVLPDTATL